MSLQSKAEEDYREPLLAHEARMRGILFLIDTDGRLKAYIYPRKNVKRHYDFLLEASMQNESITRWLRLSAAPISQET